MAEFDIVDLTAPSDEVRVPPANPVGGQGAASALGSVDTAVVASALDSLREDLAAHVKPDKTGLHLTSVTVKLSVSAEGKVAFVAKGSAEASIEVVFSTSEAT